MQFRSGKDQSCELTDSKQNKSRHEAFRNSGPHQKAHGLSISRLRPGSIGPHVSHFFTCGTLI